MSELVKQVTQMAYEFFTVPKGEKELLSEQKAAIEGVIMGAKWAETNKSDNPPLAVLFPVPDGGRSYHDAWRVSGFEKGVEWAMEIMEEPLDNEQVVDDIVRRLQVRRAEIVTTELAFAQDHKFQAEENAVRYKLNAFDEAVREVIKYKSLL